MEAPPAFLAPKDQHQQYQQAEPSMGPSSFFPIPSPTIQQQQQKSSDAFMANYANIYSLNFPTIFGGGEFGQTSSSSSSAANFFPTFGTGFCEEPPPSMVKMEEERRRGGGGHQEEAGGGAHFVHSPQDQGQQINHGDETRGEERRGGGGNCDEDVGMREEDGEEMVDGGGGGIGPDLPGNIPAHTAGAVDQLLLGPLPHPNSQLIIANGGDHSSSSFPPTTQSTAGGPFHPPPPSSQPISVIVHHHHQQQPGAKMDNADDCWPPSLGKDGPSAGHHHHSMLIRDDFIFSGGGQCASPPSASIGANHHDFLYDPPMGVTNSILEDAFLSSLQPTHHHHHHHHHSPLLDAPLCTSAASTSFLDHRDGSVGISPCSSSTQISASSPDDSASSLFGPQAANAVAHFLPARQPNRPPFSSSGHNGGVGCADDNFQLMNGIGTAEVAPAYRIVQSKVAQRGEYAGEEEEELEDGGEEEGEGDEDGEEEGEEEDVKPPTFRLVQQLDQFGAATAFTDDDAYGSLSPPPPPLTPPSKTRSKMHELALKHRLISSQNLRSHGMIQLSAEERKTLLQEGFPIPSKLPLMREEEEALKIVRRKIKNKLSAQESRRKRKEYMDMLEKRVHVYFADNTTLRQKVRHLEATNRYLMAQLQQQRTTDENGSSREGGQQ